MSWYWSEGYNTSDWSGHDSADATCLSRMCRLWYFTERGSYTSFCCSQYLFLKLNFYYFTGEIISERDRCTQCKGNKVSQEKKVLEVHVEKGMQNNQKIVFEGQADEAVSEYRFLHLQ